MTSINWKIKTFVMTLILITTFVMIPSTVISAPMQSGVMPSEKTSQWPNFDSENLTLLATQKTTGQKILPNRVFIIENRELVTQLPSAASAGSESTVEDTVTESGTTMASVTILPSRQIVVDNEDIITEVWSNTSGNDCAFYSLSVWQDELTGVEHHMTREIISQYNKLVLEMDWNRKGRVY